MAALGWLGTVIAALVNRGSKREEIIHQYTADFRAELEAHRQELREVKRESRAESELLRGRIDVLEGRLREVIHDLDKSMARVAELETENCALRTTMLEQTERAVNANARIVELETEIAYERGNSRALAAELAKLREERREL